MKFETFEGPAAGRQLAAVASIYRHVYSEEPYLEGPDDVAGFVADWPRRESAPGFRLVLAYDGDSAVGMAFGHPLRADTGWWSGLLEDAGFDTDEWPGRTFAIIELAVLKPWRRAGVGRALHDRLLTDLPEERVTLLVRPEAEARPAQAAYASWGYSSVGMLRPFQDAPTYVSLWRPL